jgi:hypothetical protein
MHLKTCIASMDAPTAQAVAIAGLHPPHVVPGQRAEDFLDPCLEEQDKDEDLLDSPWIPTPRFSQYLGQVAGGVSHRSCKPGYPPELVVAVFGGCERL